MSTSARMLQLLSLLQNHRYWPGLELSERLGISPRTLRRDVERLRELGYPVDGDRGVGGGYQLAAGAALPPLVLDDDEAVAIAVGLQAAAQGDVVGVEEASVRALTKVVAVMPRRLRRRVDALRAVTVPAAWSRAGPAVDAGTLTTLAQACRDEETLRFTYTASSGEETSRDVEPHRLVPLGRRWYLVAYDRTRHGWRSFRLRLTDPVPAGTRFRPRELPAEDAAAFVRAGIDNQPRRYTVEVVVRAPASTVQARVGHYGTVETVDPDLCRWSLVTDTLDWPAMALGDLGADFEILAPPEFVGYVHDWGALFTRAAANGGRRRGRTCG